MPVKLHFRNGHLNPFKFPTIHGSTTADIRFLGKTTLETALVLGSRGAKTVLFSSGNGEKPTADMRTEFFHIRE